MQSTLLGTMCKTKLSLTIRAQEISKAKVITKELTGIYFQRSILLKTQAHVNYYCTHSLKHHSQYSSVLQKHEFIYRPKFKVSSRSRLSGCSFQECVIYMASNSQQEPKAIEGMPNKYLTCIINNTMVIYKGALGIGPCEKMYSIYSYFWRA